LTDERTDEPVCKQGTDEFVILLTLATSDGNLLDKNAKKRTTSMPRTIRQNLQDELMKFADQRAEYQSSSEGSAKQYLMN